MYDALQTTSTPLDDLPYDQLCPESAALHEQMARYR